jgi:hypothetical protein
MLGKPNNWNVSLRIFGENNWIHLVYKIRDHRKNVNHL